MQLSEKPSKLNKTQRKAILGRFRQGAKGYILIDEILRRKGLTRKEMISTNACANPTSFIHNAINPRILELGYWIAKSPKTEKWSVFSVEGF